MEQIPWIKVTPGMRIAVEHRGGYAWRLADVQQYPERYTWWTVTQLYPDGTIHCQEGAAGVGGRHVVVHRS